MFDRNKLVNILTNEINQLENKIEHRKFYSVRNFVVKSLIRSGIAIDYALPYILATILVFQYQVLRGNIPFRYDDIKVRTGIETIDTSTGIHLEHISEDFDYDYVILEHSTGWSINDDGLYERVVTSYRMNFEIDLSNIKNVLFMSKDEIDNIFEVFDVQTINKTNLNYEDSVYNEEAIILISQVYSNDNVITRKESLGENIFNSLAFLLGVFLLGSCFKNIAKCFIKIDIRDRLKVYESLFNEINLQELEKILEIKKQNLALITSSDDYGFMSNLEEASCKIRKL